MIEAILRATLTIVLVLSLNSLGQLWLHISVTSLLTTKAFQEDNKNVYNINNYIDP